MSENNVLVIFGSTGDLTYQKLLPALTRLNELSPKLLKKIVLIGRQVETLEAYFQYGLEHGLDMSAVQPITSKLQYVYLQASETNAYGILEPILKPYQGRFFYLATPPSMFHLITHALSMKGLIKKGNPQHRLAYEKPFGENGSAAHVLNDLLHETIEEPQLYRVDHYLAKPLIQQLLKIRMQWATVGMEDLWNQQHIKTISIHAYESIGILSRGKFYDVTGALKDMVQSHLLETLALLMMDLPKRIDDIKTIQDHKIAFIQSIQPMLNQTILGQYQGYLQELNVNPSSITETFAHVPMTSSSPRWKGTRLTITTGKKLEEKRTEIIVEFHKGHSLAFNISPTIGVQFEESFLETLKPPLKQHMLQLHRHPFAREDAYVTIFKDWIQGNQTLFPSAGEIEATWKIIDAIKQTPNLPKPYSKLKDLLRK
jgi:glucose-6-phosphate 1-dehydrogenase